MPITTATPEDRQREARNASLMICKRRCREVMAEVGYPIAATPTGDRRNLLTDINILLMDASNKLNSINSEEVPNG